MRPGDTEPGDAASLRRQAEEALRAQPARPNGPLSHDDALALVHELRVHQIELELQNEELLRTRREAEALRDQYVDLYEFAPVGYLTLDRDGTILAVNLTGSVLLSEDRQALVGTRLQLLMHPDLLGAFAGFCDRVLRSDTTETFEAAMPGVRGRQQWYVLFKGRAEPGGPAGSGRIRLALSDITERKRSEEALKESEERLQSVLDNSRDVLARFNLQTGLPDFISRSVEDLLGYSPDELAIMDRETALAMVHPDDVDVLRAAQARSQETGDAEAEYRQRARSGEWVWLSNRMSTVRDDAGRPLYRINSIRDITERKRTDEALHEYTENLQRSNEDLQRFAYVASHDLQEPLRSVVSFSQLLERRYRGQLDSDADEYIAFIVEGGNRMQGLILDLLAFSRVNTTRQQITRTDVEDVFAEAVRSLDVSLREAVATLTHDPLPVVMADPLQLVHVFSNLVSNAVKFRKPDVPLHVHIGVRRLDGFWEFSVGDNGIGIEKEYFDQIFVIFQRLHTKETYPGTGIGLAIVKRIIDRHGGRIRVESTPGEGSTFYFTLPAA